MVKDETSNETPKQNFPPIDGAEMNGSVGLTRRMWKSGRSIQPSTIFNNIHLSTTP